MRVWRRLEASQLPPILRQWMAASAPQLINVARAPEESLAVNALSERIFETKPKSLAPEQLATALKGKNPLLLAGTHAEIDQALASAGLPAPPWRANPSNWPSSPARMRRRSTPCNAACPTTVGKAG
jgi:hypothetical protein